MFWDAYNTSFISRNILKAFEVTGVSPPDASQVLKRFTSPPSHGDGVPEIGQHGDGDSLKQLRKLYDDAVKDSSEVPTRRLALALHSLQVQNELLHHENEGLHEALVTKRKHAKKSKPLDLQQRKEYWGGAVFWSPRKLREAKARDAVEQQEKEEKKLRKADDKKLKEASLLYKKQKQKAVKELRESAAAARKKDADEGCKTRC